MPSTCKLLFVNEEQSLSSNKVRTYAYMIVYFNILIKTTFNRLFEDIKGKRDTRGYQGSFRGTRL